MTGRVAVAVAIVLVPLLGYPLVTLAGGSPRFPGPGGECVRPAVEGQPVDVVFGRFDHPDAAANFLDRVVGVGFAGTQVRFDGCGHWKVVLENVPSVEIGREIQEEATTVDVETTLEQGSGN